MDIGRSGTGLRVGLWGFGEADNATLRRWVADAVPDAVCLTGSTVCDGWLVSSAPDRPTWPPQPADAQVPVCGLASPIADAPATLRAQVAAWLLQLRPPKPVRPSRASTLSPRECEVLDLLSLGLSNDAIAARLSIRESTVKTYLRRVFARTGATNRAHAVAIYLAR